MYNHLSKPFLTSFWLNLSLGPSTQKQGKVFFSNPAWEPPLREYKINRPKRTKTNTVPNPQVGWRDLIPFTRRTITMMRTKPKRCQQIGPICWKGARSPNFQTGTMP